MNNWSAFCRGISAISPALSEQRTLAGPAVGFGLLGAICPVFFFYKAPPDWFALLPILEPICALALLVGFADIKYRAFGPVVALSVVTTIQVFGRMSRAEWFYWDAATALVFATCIYLLLVRVGERSSP